MRVTNGTTLLRRLHPKDLVPFLAYRRDPVVARYQSWDAMSEAEAVGFLTAMNTVTPLMRPGHWTQIALADASSDSLLGDMGWHLNEAGTEIELGITLAQAAQHRGHATRAMSSAVAHLAEVTDVSRFIAYADLRNTRSRKLMGRAGFESVGFEVAEDGIEEEIFQYLASSADA